jgi:hypothetical protein
MQSFKVPSYPKGTLKSTSFQGCSIAPRFRRKKKQK